MRYLGLILLFIGFFGAAFVSVRQTDKDRDGNRREWTAIQWPYYAAGIALGVVGVAILRVHARAAAGHSERSAANLRTLQEALSRLQERLAALQKERELIEVYALPERIDQDLAEDLARFADARETLIPLFGLQAYATIMNSFAGAERSINRAWCASADGYVDEAWACIDRAAELLGDAGRELGVQQQTLDRPRGAFA